MGLNLLQQFQTDSATVLWFQEAHQFLPMYFNDLMVGVSPPMTKQLSGIAHGYGYRRIKSLQSSVMFYLLQAHQPGGLLAVL